ncbi:hypothetical protein HMPREF9374_2980 [Desmospora sp. 8437]|nr:hypothetical protein HMPREF9374_2980 [Desmospora sp. 8437]
MGGSVPKPSGKNGTGDSPRQSLCRGFVYSEKSDYRAGYFRFSVELGTDFLFGRM